MANEAQTNKMGTMPIGPLLAKMAIPIMISMLAQALYNIVDSIFVAKLSENALNAVSLAFPLQNLMIGTGVGTAIGMNALLARSLGAKRQDAADQAANTGIFLVFCCTALFALIGLFLVRPFYLVQTDDAEIIGYGITYGKICLIGSLGLFGQLFCERALQATGRSSLSMLTQLLGAVINIVLDPILIFGLFGFPRMEVAGAAVATVIGQIIAALLGLYLNLRHNPEIHFSLRRIRWHSATVREIFRVGTPTIVMQATSSLMIFGMNLILISFTKTATAVFGAYFKLQSFVFMPVIGLNNGMVPIVSFNFGARDPERVRKTVFLTIGVAVLIMVLGALLFELCPALLLSFFSPSEQMLEIGVPALRIIATEFPIAGFCIIAGSTCQAIGNPMFSLISSLCRQLVILLPAAELLARTGVLEMVWLSFPIAAVLCAVMNFCFIRKTLRSADAHMRQA